MTDELVDDARTAVLKAVAQMAPSVGSAEGLRHLAEAVAILGGYGEEEDEAGHQH